MRHTKVILAMVAVALFCASGAFAAQVSIVDVYTMDMMQDPEDEFCVMRPVIYRIDYIIEGDPDTKYKAVIKVKALGDRLKTVEKHKPGSYTTKMGPNLTRKRHLGEPRTVKYKVILKEPGEVGIINRDSTTSELTVIECPQ